MSQHRKDAEIEAWICERLKLRDLFSGLTTLEVRRDRLQLVLTERGILDSHAGNLSGKPVTWRELLEHLYPV